MSGIKTLQEEDHHPLLDSTSASLVRRKHSKKGVKEILVERTSEHGDIVNYDS